MSLVDNDVDTKLDEKEKCATKQDECEESIANLWPIMARAQDTPMQDDNINRTFGDWYLVGLPAQLFEDTHTQRRHSRIIE